MQVYIGEVSPPALRGLFSSFPQLFGTAGIFIVYSVGAIPGFSYQYISLVAVAITAVFVVLVAPPWFPMTPYYVLMKDKEDKSGQAQKILEWLRGPKVTVTEEKEEISRVMESSAKKLTCRNLLMKQNSLTSFFLMLFVATFQQLSGVNALIFFAGNIFKNSGFDPNTAQLIASLALGLVSVIATAISVVLVDLFGRKFLLIASGLTMCVCCFGMGAQFYLTRDCSSSVNNSTSFFDGRSCSNSYKPLCDELKPMLITLVIIYKIGFAIGWGVIPSVLTSELFPLRSRGFLAGIFTMFVWGSAALISGTYNGFADLVKPYGAWWTYGICNMISSIIVAVFLPETKGKKLKDIEQQLQYRYKVCVWR